VQEPLTQESQIVESSPSKTFVNESEYERENEQDDDDVRTSDNKMIVFDEHLQRYVYMNEKDYQQLLLQHHSYHVSSWVVWELKKGISLRKLHFYLSRQPHREWIVTVTSTKSTPMHFQKLLQIPMKAFRRLVSVVLWKNMNAC